MAINVYFLYCKYFFFRIKNFHGYIIIVILMWGGVESVWHQFSLAHLSTASNWIGVQTCVHGFDSRTPHKPVVSKTSEADIWLSSYDHLTDVWGQRGGCQQLSQRKGECVLLNKKEASSGIDPSKWWWREEWWTRRESLCLPAIGTWGYPIQAYRC